MFQRIWNELIRFVKIYFQNPIRFQNSDWETDAFWNLSIQSHALRKNIKNAKKVDLMSKEIEHAVIFKQRILKIFTSLKNISLKADGLQNFTSKSNAF